MGLFANDDIRYIHPKSKNHESESRLPGLLLFGCMEIPFLRVLLQKREKAGSGGVGRRKWSVLGATQMSTVAFIHLWGERRPTHSFDSGRRGNSELSEIIYFHSFLYSTSQSFVCFVSRLCWDTHQLPTEKYPFLIAQNLSLVFHWNLQQRVSNEIFCRFHISLCLSSHSGTLPIKHSCHL